MVDALEWQIGAVRVTAVVEMEWPLRVDWMMPDATPDAVASMPWLRDAFLVDGETMTIAVQAFTVESRGRRIVVDTCAGNGKRRGGLLQMFDGLDTDLPARMSALGLPFASIDTVVCTHLHFDHVGWNTVLVGDEWVPAFEQARYVLTAADVAHWSTHPEEMHSAAYDDSIAPLLTAGVADVVDVTADGHVLTDEVRLIATPGHSPGHVSVLIESGGRRALITGDAVHHPVQLARPQWRDITDVDATRAAATRVDLARRAMADGVLVLGTHFAAPTAGNLVVRDGDAVFVTPSV